jgi:hypothetical protein
MIASRLRIEPRSGGIPLAPGVSPGFTRTRPKSAGGAKDSANLPPLTGLFTQSNPTPGLRPGLEEFRRSAAQFGCGFRRVFSFKSCRGNLYGTN